MRLGQVCWEDFLEAVVLDLSSDTENREEKVSLIITAHQERVLGNSGGSFSEGTVFDRGDALGYQGGFITNASRAGLEKEWEAHGNLNC